MIIPLYSSYFSLINTELSLERVQVYSISILIEKVFMMYVVDVYLYI